MRRTIRVGLAALAALAAGAASAQPYGDPAQTYAGQAYASPYGGQAYRAPQPYPYPSQAYPRQDDRPRPYGARGYEGQPYAQPACCRVPAGAEVAVELVEAVGTHEKKAGDTFALRLAAPLIVDGQVVVPAGTRGQGHVVQSSGPGLGGKGAKLVVAADFLTVKGGIIPLQGLQLTGAGKDETFAADIASLAGWISAPLGLVGFAVTGGQIEVPAGTAASAKVAREVSLKPLGAAAGEDYAEVKAVFGERASSHGWIEVPPPPSGQGQVVFFRIKAPANFGTWFNVRENGEALGKLGNGAYFIARFNPGVHTFTAKLEPEFKDRLTLKIDPGETYYVEGAMTHGALIGVADLVPSDKAHFDANSHDLEASAARPAAPNRVG